MDVDEAHGEIPAQQNVHIPDEQPSNHLRPQNIPAGEQALQEDKERLVRKEDQVMRVDPEGEASHENLAP